MNIELIIAGVGVVSTVASYILGRCHANKIVEGAIRHGFEVAVERVSSFKPEIPVALGKVGAQAEPVVELVMVHDAPKDLPPRNRMQFLLSDAARRVQMQLQQGGTVS
jgi:hypothetical protein